MKKILVLIVSIIVSFEIFGQTFDPTGKSTFYDMIVDYFDSTHYSSPDSVEGGVDGMVREMYYTWTNRLAPHGKFGVASKAMVQYAQTYDYQAPNYQPNWRCLGPNGMPLRVTGSQNKGRGIGQIHRITFPTNYDGINNRTVYASSFYGGLWRSFDGGDNWELCNTDFLPMTSVSDVALNPEDPNMVFISTGMADLGFTMTVGSNWGDM